MYNWKVKTSPYNLRTAHTKVHLHNCLTAQCSLFRGRLKLHTSKQNFRHKKWQSERVDKDVEQHGFLSWCWPIRPCQPQSLSATRPCILFMRTNCIKKTNNKSGLDTFDWNMNLIPLNAVLDFSVVIISRWSLDQFEAREHVMGVDWTQRGRVK